MERTTTCDACGRQFIFTDFRHDRCPYCCPKEEQDDVWGDDLTQESDFSDIHDLPPE